MFLIGSLCFSSQWWLTAWHQCCKDNSFAYVAVVICLPYLVEIIDLFLKHIQSTQYQSWNIFENLHSKVYSFIPLRPQHGGNGILAGLTTRPWSLWQRHSKTGGEWAFFFLSFTSRGGVRFSLLRWTKIAVSHPWGWEPSQHIPPPPQISCLCYSPSFLFSLFFCLFTFPFYTPQPASPPLPLLSLSLSNSSHFVSVPLNVSFTPLALYKNALKSFDIAAERGGTMLQIFIFQ